MARSISYGIGFCTICFSPMFAIAVVNVENDMVLPGFSPVEVVNDQIVLGANRSYVLGQKLLPSRLAVKGINLVGQMELRYKVGDLENRVNLRNRTPISRSQRAAKWTSYANVAPGLDMNIQIEVEYDGLAIVDLTINPRQPTNVDSVSLSIPILRGTSTRVMGFEPRTIFWSKSGPLIPTCYEGPYRSVLAFADGNVSFWWFTDDPAPGLLEKSALTIIRCDEGLLHLEQPLAQFDEPLTVPLHLRFAFLVTPVRELPSKFRSDRVVAEISSREAVYGTRHLWWIDATAHYALPYADYPPGVRSLLPMRDVKAYPGAATNRKRVARWRDIGIERLPYLSLRALSPLDPEVKKNRSEWQIAPPTSMPESPDLPYVYGLPRPILSFRGTGLSNHLLTQLEDLVMKIGVGGFYFDQAAPAGSKNVRHLAQRLSQSRTESWVTDILALRAFFERLARMLVRNGHDPLIYVHTSTAPVVPAFSFVTAMVQGEELLMKLNSLSYIEAASLAYIRTAYAGGQYAIPTIWLEELWSSHLAPKRPRRFRSAELESWVESQPYKSFWREYMGLALLHDVPIWSLASLDQRSEVFSKLDEFGIDESIHIGYWNHPAMTSGSELVVSAYFHAAQNKLLLVAMNIGDDEVELTETKLMAVVRAVALLVKADRSIDRFDLFAEADVVPPRDFALVSMYPSDIR